MKYVLTFMFINLVGITMGFILFSLILKIINKNS